MRKIEIWRRTEPKRVVSWIEAFSWELDGSAGRGCVFDVRGNEIWEVDLRIGRGIENWGFGAG